jgi:Cys-rich repeat protein
MVVMRLLAVASFCFIPAFFAACGGQVSQGATGGSTSSTSSGSVSHGCKTNADCGGGTCQALTPGGYSVCLSTPAEATTCQMGGPPMQCCSSAQCASMGGGSCYPSQSLQFCGGAQLQSNTCVTDRCTSDADCVKNTAPAICAPAGTFGNPMRFCLNAWCKTDADCTTKPGGACVLVGNNPCCKLPAPDGLACVYPGSCVTDSDCPKGQVCHLDSSGVSRCTANMIGCPG